MRIRYRWSRRMLIFVTAFLLFVLVTYILLYLAIEGPLDNSTMKVRNYKAWMAISTFEQHLKSQRKKEKCKKYLPKALVVGFAKCGTDALMNFLSLHPSISAVLYPTETYFFSRQYQKGLTWYELYMRCSYSDQISIEKTPDYSTDPMVPARVKQFNPDMRIIFIIREPVQRIVSHYIHEISVSRVKYPPFEQQLLKEDRSINEQHNWVITSRYTEHIQRWLKYFPANQILVLNGDNFQVNPAQELQRCEKFLEIQPLFVPELFTFNKEKGFYCAPRFNSTSVLKCVDEIKSKTTTHIDEYVLKLLASYFKTENEKLYLLLGKRVQWHYNLN